MSSSRSEPVSQPIDPQEVLRLVVQVGTESNPGLRLKPDAGLDALLDRDHGLDSLARMELMSRLERRFGVVIGEREMAEAQTPRDLCSALDDAEGAPAPGLPTGAEGVQALTPRAARASVADEGTPELASTLVDALEWHAAKHPQRVHVRYYDEHWQQHTLTYAELHRDAARVAAGLRAAGVEPGESVAIMLPTELGYFACFVGVLMIGAVPVPIYPPARLSQIEDHFTRHVKILENARTVALITFAEARQVVRLLTTRVSGLRSVIGLDELMSHGEVTDAPLTRAGDTAFLQYTSGSTGNPKGVVLSHANVLASLRSMQRGADVGPDDVFVSWLPLYHDLGLIGAWLGAMYVGYTLVLMSPLTFLARPERWLHAIHEQRGTISGGPNFAYELCLRRLGTEQLEGLDLSSLAARVQRRRAGELTYAGGLRSVHGAVRLRAYGSGAGLRARRGHAGCRLRAARPRAALRPCASRAHVVAWAGRVRRRR